MLKKQLISFILIGIVNTIVGYLLYAFFIYIGFHYFLALFVATALGILFNFQTIGRVVFKSNDKKLLLKFFFVYFVVFLVNIVMLKIFKLFGYSDYMAGFLIIFPAAALSFVLNKFYVFRK